MLSAQLWALRTDGAPRRESLRIRETLFHLSLPSGSRGGGPASVQLRAGHGGQAARARGNRVLAAPEASGEGARAAGAAEG